MELCLGWLAILASIAMCLFGIRGKLKIKPWAYVAVALFIIGALFVVHNEFSIFWN